jgi:hypothetical protein
MTRPVISSFTATHPRLLFKASDKTLLQARATAPKFWADWFSNKMFDYAFNNRSASASSLLGTPGAIKSAVHQKCLTFATVGYLTDAFSTDIKAQAITLAKYLAQTWATPVISEGTQEDREVLLGMAFVFDILFQDISAADRKIIGDGIIAQCDLMSLSYGELMDGHSGGDQACQLIGALALVGESGAGYDYTTGGSNATTRLNEALDFWFGQNAGDQARFDYDRYFGADGGSGKGVWYQNLGYWYTSLFSRCYHNAVASSTLDGDDYTLYTNESWWGKVGEWFLNAHARGDLEYFKIGDTARVSSPLFHEYSRVSLAHLMTHGGAWRGNICWLYRILNALETGSAYTKTLDFLLCDPDDPANISTPPATNAVATSRLFAPPGSYFYRSSWDIAGEDNCIVNIHAPEYYYLGHQDLDVGSIQINVGKDMVLCNTGTHSSSDAKAKYGGSHCNEWQRQSLSKSGIVLVDDEAGVVAATPVEDSTPHTNKNEAGTHTTYNHGEGGQLHKKYVMATGTSTAATSNTITLASASSAINNAYIEAYIYITSGPGAGQSKRITGYVGSTKVATVASNWSTNPTASGYKITSIDPISTTNMTSHLGGLAWKRTTSVAGDVTKGIQLLKSTALYDYLAWDSRYAYLRQYPDLGGSSERVRMAQNKIIVIKAGVEHKWPILFRVARYQSRLASMKKKDPWHFWGNPVVGSFGTTGAFYADGYYADTISSGGRCWIAYHNFAGYSTEQIGDSAASFTGTSLADAKFRKFEGGSSSGANYPPANTPGARHLNDIGRFRLSVKPIAQNVEDSFVCLIMPMAHTDSPPSYTLSDDIDWWIVTFPATQHVYKIHKLTSSVIGPDDGVDTAPPSAPTNVAATNPLSQTVVVSWTGDSNDTSMNNGGKYRVSYRVKV